ncbi:MAG: cytochrome d ubiquinol oxidase subunit II [Pseudomonadota bacterium]
MIDMTVNGHWLPIFMMMIMGLALLLYVILDGFDLGIGILMHFSQENHRERMLSTIAPFWDANETWLVLGIGVMLVAFPKANGIIFGHLYFPITLMLIGLILRGVSFDFRAKVATRNKKRWESFFILGSLLTTLAQGYMLSSYILGFHMDGLGFLFTLFVTFGLLATYTLLGACWLLIKTSNDLQTRALEWAKKSLVGFGVGLLTISLVTPLVSNTIFEKWFAFPNILVLLPIPLLSIICIAFLYYLLNKQPDVINRYTWLPLVLTTLLVTFCFNGLAYSFYPYIILDELTVWDASISLSSLQMIFYGIVLVLPFIFAWTVYAHWTFRGKLEKVSYY